MYTVYILVYIYIHICIYVHIQSEYLLVYIYPYIIWKTIRLLKLYIMCITLNINGFENVNTGNLII